MPEIIKKSVEQEFVNLNIEVSKEFFDLVENAKKEFEQKLGREMTYGEYIEEAMMNLVTMVEAAMFAPGGVVKHVPEKVDVPNHSDPNSNMYG